MFKRVDTEQARYNTLKEQITIDGKLINLGQLLYHSAQKYPENVALILNQKNMSYQELFYRASLFSTTLKEAGAKPRDRILLFFENSIEFYIGYYGIAQLGAVVVPLNTFLKDHELAHIIGDSQPSLMVASTDLLAKLEQDHITLAVTVVTQAQMDLDSAVDKNMCQPVSAYLDPDEMAALLYTSGTTGLPKGVMLSSTNILINCIQELARIEFIDKERVLGVLPLFHSFAQNTCVWGALLAGCCVIIVPKIERRYILEGLTHKPTIFLGIPALFGLMCLLKTADVSSVRYFASGGDAMPDKIRAGFEMIYQRKICDGYGLSETSPVLTADLEDVAKPTNSVGAPLIGVEIAIRAQDGTHLPAGSVGEIWAKGPNVMLGYYNEPEKTQEVLKNGWLDTGDLGYMDWQGKLVITGRLKDIIINKGFKIYPQEIENVLLMHANVIRAAVIGHTDPATGEIAVAYVQLKQQEPGIEQGLLELCQRYLAAYKVPRKFICQTTSLPLTATGKVDKKVLRKNHLS